MLSNVTNVINVIRVISVTVTTNILNSELTLHLMPALLQEHFSEFTWAFLTTAVDVFSMFYGAMGNELQQISNCDCQVSIHDPLDAAP